MGECQLVQATRGKEAEDPVRLASLDRPLLGLERRVEPPDHFVGIPVRLRRVRPLVEVGVPLERHRAAVPREQSIRAGTPGTGFAPTSRSGVPLTGAEGSVVRRKRPANQQVRREN